MNWYIPLFIYIILLVSQTMWQRRYAKKSLLPDTFPPALSYVIVLMPISIIVGLIMPHEVSWSAWLTLLLLVEGFFIGMFNWLMFAALGKMPAAKFEMIFQLYTVVIVILGWLLLSEKLTFIQICGGILLLLAAYLAIQAPLKNIEELTRKSDKKAVWLAIGAALTLGIGLVTEKAALQYMDIGAYFIFGFATQALAVVLLATKDFSRKAFKLVKPSDFKQIIVMGLISVTVGFSYISAIKLADNISLVTVLSTVSLPLIVLSGYLFLHERENMKRLCIATMLGFIGLILASL